MDAVRCGDCSSLTVLDNKLDRTASGIADGTDGVLVDLRGSEMG